MIKIVVDSSEIVERRGVSKTSGNDYHLRIQTAYAFTVKDSGAVSQFPDKFEILLEKDVAPYAPGNYTLAPSAVFVGRDGRIELRPRLTAVPTKS
jgi:hypothetical protein